MRGAASLCGCHYRAQQAALGPVSDAAERRAEALCGPWGCGTEAAHRSPSHEAVAAHVTALMGLSAPPAGCPLAAVYRSAPPIAHRAVSGLAAMEDGLSDHNAFPGGVTAADVRALAILRRGRGARMRSDDALRERERRQKEAASLAAKPGTKR